MAPTATEPSRVLGRRLRGLRETRFPGVTITQRALGRVFGGDQPLSAPLISSWEKGSATPTKRWIAAYATFFATSRSVEGASLRLLGDDELDTGERTERDALQSELLSLRAKALRVAQAASGPDPTTALGGPWHLRDGNPVRIVCAEIPEDQQNPDATPTHPTLTYGQLYSYASIDALFELHGHVRAANPRSEVRVLKTSQLEPDDLAAHLVILGGVDRNALARRIPALLPDFPIRQISDGLDPRDAYFEISGGDEEPAIQHGAVLSDNSELVWDVGLFVRAPNPANQKRTLTICNAMYSVGTLGVVRALTDERFRDRNEEYLYERFLTQDTFSILMRILILNGDEAVTPDWTVPANRLYEWPERKL